MRKDNNTENVNKLHQAMIIAFMVASMLFFVLKTLFF